MIERAEIERAIEFMYGERTRAVECEKKFLLSLREPKGDPHD